MAKKTILLTHHYWQGNGGVERVVVNLANAFVKRDYNVEIMTLAPDLLSTEGYVLDSRVQKVYFPVIDTRNLTFVRAAIAKVNIFLALRKFFRNYPVNFAIKNEFVIPPLFFRLNNVPTATLFHGCYHYYSFTFRKRINLWGATYNIILSTKEQYKWERILNHVAVIPNMVIPIKRATGIQREKRVLAVGHLNENKAFDRLIRAYLPLTKEMPDWKLIIVGEGIEYSKLRALIDLNGVQQKIEILPPTNRIEEQYAMASICVLSSYLEGFPMVLVEAMGFGIPCVAFNINTGPSDIIQHGHTGFLVPDGDELALESALRKLMQNQTLREEMGIEACASVSRFSEEAVMNKWIKLMR